MLCILVLLRAMETFPLNLGNIWNMNLCIGKIRYIRKDIQYMFIHSGKTLCWKEYHIENIYIYIG